MEKSQELLKREFMHVLADVLALLGAGEFLVRMVQYAEETPLTQQLVDEFRRFVTLHIDEVKTRLWLCHTMRVKPSGDNEQK